MTFSVEKSRFKGSKNLYEFQKYASHTWMDIIIGIFKIFLCQMSLEKISSTFFLMLLSKAWLSFWSSSQVNNRPLIWDKLRAFITLSWFLFRFSKQIICWSGHYLILLSIEPSLIFRSKDLLYITHRPSLWTLGDRKINLTIKKCQIFMQSTIANCNWKHPTNFLAVIV